MWKETSGMVRKTLPRKKQKKQKENINIVINLLVAYFFSMLICVEAFFYN